MSAPRAGQVLRPTEPPAPDRLDNVGADGSANRAEFALNRKAHGVLIAPPEEAVARGRERVPF